MLCVGRVNDNDSFGIRQFLIDDLWGILRCSQPIDSNNSKSILKV